MESKKLNKLVVAKFNSLAGYKAHGNDEDLADALKLIPFNVEFLKTLGIEAHVAAGGGYIKFGPLFGGAILQWGQGVENKTITYPISFPNEATSVVVTNSHPDGRRYGLTAIRKTNTSFYVQVGDDDTGECTFNWIAIGY